MSLVDEIGGSRGILTLLGFQQTIGSRNLAPLTLRQCLAAFKKCHTPGEQLTVGARAFSKHCARSSNGWWGELRGNDTAKNACAESKVRELLANATWKIFTFFLMLTRRWKFATRWDMGHDGTQRQRHSEAFSSRL
ncbi:unnamed protein product [Peronospora belbahrii]|uniref:Uncharacterized protein n=1 Tax=Peronospora belbahrii TaxID=622444 RepID=A0AAU9KM09_9STRA|nr:unnamed protein product [Peronospora belbahrii]